MNLKLSLHTVNLGIFTHDFYLANILFLNYKVFEFTKQVFVLSVWPIEILY